MAESNQPQFLQLGHAPVFLTPATETSFTLSPATEIGDPFAPAIEKAGFVASAEASADETLTSESPAIGSTGGEIFVVNALPALLDTIPDHGASIYGTATVDASNDEIHTSDLIAPRPTTKDLLDCQNRLMAELLTRFTNLVKLATAPEEDGATLEAQAALSLQMDVETTALVKAIEDLHRLTRDLKELWLAGPLRGIGEGESDGDMANNATEVQKLVDDITKKVRELNGGNDVQSK